MDTARNRGVAEIEGRSLGKTPPDQPSELLRALQAMRDGDFSVRLPGDWTGIDGKIADTFNEIAVANARIAGELDRAGHVVGKQGRTRHRVKFDQHRGAWGQMESSVNTLIDDLLWPTTEMTRALSAVAQGDLLQTVRLDVDGRPLEGEFLRLATIVNTMIQQLGVFTSEVTRVAREVGTDGKLGGQAQVQDVSGVWKDLTDSVNSMANNLTAQVRNLAEVTIAVADGDLSKKITVDVRGEILQLKEAINTMVDQLRSFASEVTRVAREVGTDGKLGGQAIVPGVAGTWKDLTDSVNAMCGNLTGQVRNIAQVTTAVARGDLSRKITVDVRGEILELKDTINTMVDQLNAFASEVTRVAREVGTDGKLGGQAQVPGVAGTWKDLTDNVNFMASSIEATMQTEGLLTQSQQLATELQTQQKELQQTNEQLAQKAQQLAEQNVEVERKNQEIDQARRAVEEKAAELALTSKYKSEFLANMSHELRTPLNSILILGQQLAENPEGNLSGRQVEFARTIHGAGTDLLNLISDILDLSKIESGTVTVEAEEVFFANLLDMVGRTFRHEAESRGLTFEIQVDPRLGRSILTDAKRLQQVLKNLLSNAFKFTAHGGVRLGVSEVAGGWAPDHPVLSQAAVVAAFEVSDSGIGIPLEKQRIIFEAFQQADASTSRKYGGTGLGLAISRELASLLGGEIQLRSTPMLGSTFTLYLPLRYAGPSIATKAIHVPGSPISAPSFPVVNVSDRTIEVIADDRHDLSPDDTTLLVVEDDPNYARILIDLARTEGFKVLLAMRGEDALALARQYLPTAISLDVFLPDMLGWTVLSQLKQDPHTRHIPVQIVTLDEDRQHGLARGAFSFVSKPTSSEGLKAALDRIKTFALPRRKRLLVVEDNAAERMGIQELLAHDDIDIVTADSGETALVALAQESCDCVVLDLRLPDMSGFEVLDRIAKNEAWRDLPVVVFTGRELSSEEELQLHSIARSVVVKGVESPERLLDETSLFLHRVVADLPSAKQQMLDRLHRSDEALIGKTVLVVDDDVRNIFALSSVLERRGMQVLTAATGREAITTLESTPELAIALMDVMMPEMDGYETIRAIRENPSFRRLPIIALTAKAMKGDREKCLEAGASDYLAKPVNTEQLLTALRMWLHR